MLYMWIESDDRPIMCNMFVYGYRIKDTLQYNINPNINTVVPYIYILAKYYAILDHQDLRQSITQCNNYNI